MGRMKRNPEWAVARTAPVTRDLGGGDIAPTTACLMWTPADPAAATMVIADPSCDADDPKRFVTWMMARDLLGYALEVPGPRWGAGDVAVAANAETVRVDLSSAEGRCSLEWPAETVAKFLAETRAVIESGSEEEGARYTAGLDAELAELLEAGGR